MEQQHIQYSEGCKGQFVQVNIEPLKTFDNGAIINVNGTPIDELIKKFQNQPIQFMNINEEILKTLKELKDQRPKMPIAMADKTFTVTTTGIYSGNEKTEYTGTLELEGSFAVIRKWNKGELQGIKIIPSHLIIDIEWKPAKTVKIDATNEK